MSDFNVQLPQDGSGKRIKHKVQLEVVYKNKTGDIKLGDLVLCTNSNVTGTVTYIAALSGTTGHLYLDVAHHSPLITTDSENIEINSVTVAQVNGSGTPYYIPVNMLVGGNSGFYEQYVDKSGAAYTRFTEGSPQFDSYGRMQVSATTILGEYMHTYDIMPEHYQDDVLGSGAVSYEQSGSNILLDVGTTLGDYVSRTTHKYHKFQPGTSQLVEFSTTAGDTGKVGLTRWMGYGESWVGGSDGVYLILEDLSIKFIIRSSTSGSVVDTEVLASDFNGDRLDGSGGTFNLSGKQLNPTKANIYWMDLQWGAGRIRFGVIIDGVRVVMHEEYHANIADRAYMRTGSLPLTYGMINTGTTASASQMRLQWGSVKTEGDFNPIEERFSYETSSLITINSDSYKPVLSFRPKQTLNSMGNRIWIVPCSFQVHVIGDPCIVDVVREPTLTGATWAIDPGAVSGCELDIAATSYTGGRQMCSYPVTVEREIPANRLFGYNKEISMRKADITADPIFYSLVARNIEAAKTAQMFVSINWREIR